jgi:hypothetical protein
MHFLSIAFPAEVAIPVAKAFAGLARPLAGLTILAALLMLFKPLIVGILHAALLVIKPRKSLQERKARSNVQAVRTLNRMARDLDSSQPNLAAELRMLASRG